MFFVILILKNQGGFLNSTLTDKLPYGLEWIYPAIDGAIRSIDFKILKKGVFSLTKIIKFGKDLRNIIPESS